MNDLLKEVADEMTAEIRSEVSEVEVVEATEEVAEETSEEVSEEVSEETENNDPEAAEEVEQAEEVETENRSISTTPTPSKNMDTLNNLQERFSVARAIKAVTNGQALTGAEAEASQEARHQAAANGVQLSGQIAMPSEFRADPMSATVTTGGVQTSEDIFDDPKGIVGNLRPDTVFNKLGATYFRNATGPVVIPVQTGNISTSELDELASITPQNITMSQVTLNPQRIGAGTSYSRQLLTQSLENLDMFIMGDLNKSMGLAQDNYLLGKMYAGITAADATGLDVAELPYLMEETLRLADANADAAKFLIDPTTNRRFRRAALDAGSGLFAGTNVSTIGYGNVVSTQFNADDAIMGDFSDFVVCEWGGVDLIVDPYTGAAQDAVKVTANTYLDGTVRRAGSFTRYNNIGA